MPCIEGHFKGGKSKTLNPDFTECCQAFVNNNRCVRCGKLMIGDFKELPEDHKVVKKEWQPPNTPPPEKVDGYFYLIKNCKCVYCDGKDSVHAISSFFAPNVYVLGVEYLALSVEGFSKRELLAFRRQLDKKSYEGHEKQKEIEEEIGRLQNTLAGLITIKNCSEGS